MLIKISVVIPTFNRPLLLKKCLHALRWQETNVRYEVIVVSDGKDEKTEALLNEFSAEEIPFIYTSLDKKSGPAAARNKGWQMANGELIVFTDDDTQPSKKWLHHYWKAYINTSQQTLAVSQSKLESNHVHHNATVSINLVAFTGQVKVPITERPTDYERNSTGLETADFVTANCAITKNALCEINGFDESFTMAWREDSEIQFKLLTAGIPIVKVTDAEVLHPVRKAAWGVSLKEQKKSMFNALLYKKHPQLFRSTILAAPVWNYYAIIVSFIVAVLLLQVHFYLSALLAGSLWLVLISQFIMRRLDNNSLSFSHITEMIVTSILIPFLSVFWTLYGAFKFRVFFL